MLIVALVLAVIGLAALVTAVVTSNELIAWVCIGASVIGVLLLIVDALRERSKGTDGVDSTQGDDGDDATTVMPAVADPEAAEDYPDEPADLPAEPEPEPSTVGVEAREGSNADGPSDDAPEAKRD
jgi:membrane protein implicated in regulation of membrane protease activity